MFNCTVLHKLNGEVINRYEFGEELDKAINFIHDIMEECDQIGKHHFTVVDENKGTVYYNQRFEIIAE